MKIERLLPFCSERFSKEGRELQIWQENGNPAILHIADISGVVLCNEIINKVGTQMFVIRFQSYHPAEIRWGTLCLPYYHCLSQSSRKLIFHIVYLWNPAGKNHFIIKTSNSRESSKFRGQEGGMGSILGT